MLDGGQMNGKGCTVLGASWSRASKKFGSLGASALTPTADPTTLHKHLSTAASASESVPLRSKLAHIHQSVARPCLYQWVVAVHETLELSVKLSHEGETEEVVRAGRPTLLRLLLWPIMGRAHLGSPTCRLPSAYCTGTGRTGPG